MKSLLIFIASAFFTTSTSTCEYTGGKSLKKPIAEIESLLNDLKAEQNSQKTKIAQGEIKDEFTTEYIGSGSTYLCNDSICATVRNRELIEILAGKGSVEFSVVRVGYRKTGRYIITRDSNHKYTLDFNVILGKVSEADFIKDNVPNNDPWHQYERILNDYLAFGGKPIRVSKKSQHAAEGFSRKKAKEAENFKKRK